MIAPLATTPINTSKQCNTVLSPGGGERGPAVLEAGLLTGPDLSSRPGGCWGPGSLWVHGDPARVSGCGLACGQQVA